MKLGVYSLLDTQTGVFSLPFFQSHPAIAKRAVSDLVSDLGTVVGRHPASFALYLLGEFDDNSGSFENVHPVMICSCSSLVPQDLARLPLEEAAQ